VNQFAKLYISFLCGTCKCEWNGVLQSTVKMSAMLKSMADWVVVGCYAETFSLKMLWTFWWMPLWLYVV
jgi:hypothetical protein